MKRPVIFLIGLSSALSCHKDTNPPPTKGWDWFGTHDAAVYNYVLLSGNQVTNRSDTNDFQISVNAAFIDSNTNRLAGVSDLQVNERNISRNVDSTYNFGFNDSGYIQEGLALFGRNVTVRIKGKTDTDTVSTSIYLPKRIVKAISDFPDILDLSSDLSLSWDPDEQSPWHHVVVQVYYYPNLSHYSDSSLPADIKPLNLTVPDDGHYVLTSKQLQRFPPKSVVGISIARGTQTVVVLPVSLKRVYIFSSSSASTLPLHAVVNY
jgi:hypothetical protein